MIGVRVNKPLVDDYTFDSEGKPIKVDLPNTREKFQAVIDWCNANEAFIDDSHPDYYEVKRVPEPPLEKVAYEVRMRRDGLLSCTDYLVTPDYPISTEDLEAVKVYRKALRDIPEQSGFPKNVQWPVEPQFLSAKKNEGSIGLAKVGI